MSLLFNMLSKLVIIFLPRSKHLLISWLQSPSTVILEPRKIKSATVSTFSPSICHEVMGPDAMILVLWMLSFKPLFHSPLSLSSRGSLVLLHLKRLPTMQETWIPSLGWEDPLEKEMAAHSSILAWKIPWTEEPGWLLFMGSQRVGHNWATSLSIYLSLSAIRVVSFAYLRLLIFLPALLIPACA